MTIASLQSQHADPEFQTWSLLHARDNRLHGAELAQITKHHDPNPAGDALHQLQAWARRQAREKQMQASAIAHLRYCPPVPIRRRSTSRTRGGGAAGVAAALPRI